MNKLKFIIAYLINLAFDFLFVKRKPIILVGEVGKTHAKILIAVKGKLEDDIKIQGNYQLHRKKLITQTNKYSAICVTLENLESSKTHNIAIQVNGETYNIQFKTQKLENTKKATILVGSCNLHTLKPINNSNTKFDTLNKLRKEHDVDFMLHLGDQIYSDVPFPYFFPTFDYYCEKYFSAWSYSPNTNKFISNISNYMILDDHEIIDNYRNRSDREKYKHGIEVYKIFQLSHSPVEQNKTHYKFDYNGIPFFVLDARTTRNVKEHMLICEEQKDELFAWLLQNKHNNTFKFICTSVPFLIDMKNSEGDKWCSSKFRFQRNCIIDFIVSNDIQNVVFLSGDVHCSLLTKSSFINKQNNTSVYINEITSSPINQIFMEDINSFVRLQTVETPNAVGKISTYRYYDEHSNVALLKISDDKIVVDYFRTSTGENVQSETIDIRVE